MRVRKKRSYRWLPFMAVAVMLLGAFWSVDRQLRQAVSEVVRYRVGVLAMEMMTESVAAGLGQADELVAVMTGVDGMVTSVQTDTARVAGVQTAILSQLLERLSQAEADQVEVPLGNLFWGQWLSEMGPSVSFSFSPEGAVNARTVSQFSSAGVNQTCHRIVLTLETTLGAVTSFGSVSVTVPAEFILAETVIVGAIPENYTEVITEDRELVRELNDYKP